MDWARLVIGVLLLISSHSLSQDIDANCSESATTNRIDLFLGSNCPGLQLCLRERNENGTSSDKISKCYEFIKENGDSSYSWTLQDPMKPTPPPSCSTTLSHTVVEQINTVIGVLGGIIALLLVILLAIGTALYHVHGFRSKNFQDPMAQNDNRTSTVKEMTPKGEETLPDKAETPTPPARPSWTLTNSSKRDDDYINPNDIAPWTVAELKQKSNVIGNIIVDQ